MSLLSLNSKIANLFLRKLILNGGHIKIIYIQYCTVIRLILYYTYILLLPENYRKIYVKPRYYTLALKQYRNLHQCKNAYVKLTHL